jgi:hypothetical protein
VHKIWYNIFEKIMVVHFWNIFFLGASKKPSFDAKKIKNDFFVQRKLKFPKSTLFYIPRCTHVKKMTTRSKKARFDLPCLLFRTSTWVSRQEYNLIVLNEGVGAIRFLSMSSPHHLHTTPVGSAFVSVLTTGSYDWQ